MRISLWSTIEAYLDLPDIVRMSAACKAMHCLIIDEDRRKIKIEEFNFPLGGVENIKNKTPHFLLGALNAVHFQSLRRIYIDFSGVRDWFSDPVNETNLLRQQKARNDAAIMCFPVFVANLAYAKNLESLHFDPDAAIDKFGLMQGLFQMLAKNLANCKMLQELGVVNCCIEHRHHRERPWEYVGSAMTFCYALISALRPTLKKRKDTLESFKYRVGGIQAGFDFSVLSSRDETHDGQVILWPCRLPVVGLRLTFERCV